ncbi:DUF4747 family protein, partial [Pseudomonas sp. ATCC 13867]
GELYKFLKLDAAEAWFNLRDMDEATNEDVAELVIPEHLKPHFQTISVYFLSERASFLFH